MCPLNAAARKYICASVREPPCVREGQGLGKITRLRRRTSSWSKQHHHWGGRSESWECCESRSPKHFPNKGGRLKADSFSPGFQSCSPAGREQKPLAGNASAWRTSEAWPLST